MNKLYFKGQHFLEFLSYILDFVPILLVVIGFCEALTRLATVYTKLCP